MTNDGIRRTLAVEVADLQETAALALVRQRLDAGEDPMAIVDECERGMRLVGERYERREYFLSGLIMAGEIFRQVIDLVQPSMEQHIAGKASGRVLLGTVQGDIHDIGKDLVHILLRCFGFTVVDLGVNVPPARFLEAAMTSPTDIVGLSGILTSSFESLRETVRALRVGTPAHIKRIPIIIGGGQLNGEVCRFVGADHWVTDGVEGVRLCQRLVGSQRSGARGQGSGAGG